MHFSKIDNQHLCLLSCAVPQWMDGSSLPLHREFCLSLGSRNECVSQVLTQLCRQHQHCWSWYYRAQELFCLWSGFETKIISFCSTKALENQGGGLVSWFLVSSQSFPTLEAGKGLGWAEMVPDLSQWQWTFLTVFLSFQSTATALSLCRIRDVGYRAGDKLPLEQAESSVITAVPTWATCCGQGRVGPQKPLVGAELFLLCRIQEPGLPKPWREAIRFSPSFIPSFTFSLCFITFPYALHPSFSS